MSGGYFKTEKVGRSRVNVFDANTGEFLCQLTRKEVDGWIARATASRVADEAFAVEFRATRVAIVREYLEARKRRAEARTVQLELF